MYSTILVGTDGSGPATRAVDLAAQIARATGGKLIAVSAYSSPSATGTLEGSGGPGITAAEGLLKDVVNHHSEGIEVETFAVGSDPAEAILDIAKSHNADLIVTGDRGMSGARRMLGSVPNTVTHHAPCDILIAHTADGVSGPFKFSKALLATDGSATASVACERGAAFAEALGVEPILMTAGGKESSQDLLRAQAAKLGRSIKLVSLDGSPSDAILEVAKSEGCDLIVTGSKGMQGARRLLGSVPNSVSHHLETSMLIVKTK